MYVLRSPKKGYPLCNMYLYHANNCGFPYSRFHRTRFLKGTMATLFTVCFIKIRSKHSNNKLLSVLQIFMKQTLDEFLEIRSKVWQY